VSALNTAPAQFDCERAGALAFEFAQRGTLPQTLEQAPRLAFVQAVEHRGDLVIHRSGAPC